MFTVCFTFHGFFLTLSASRKVSYQKQSKTRSDCVIRKMTIRDSGSQSLTRSLQRSLLMPLKTS